MGNINIPTLEYFQSFANEMLSKFRRVSQLTNHGPSSGEYHEEILRNILRNFLSKRFSVKTGFIYSEKGASSQIDIMVVDENNPMAYIFQEGDFAIAMPEAVVATIEVKSTIMSKTFNEAVSKISQIKDCYEFPSAITSIIFSYDGGTSSDSTLDKWFKMQACVAIKNKKQLSPDAILFFSKKLLLLPFSEQLNHSPSSGSYKKVIASPHNLSLEGSHLSILLALIVNACIQKGSRDTHYFPTVQADRLIEGELIDFSREMFTMGEGLIT